MIHAGAFTAQDVRGIVSLVVGVAALVVLAWAWDRIRRYMGPDR